MSLEEFPYALWRDVVSDATNLYVLSALVIAFPYALWRDVVSDPFEIKVLLWAMLEFPYALWRDVVSDKRFNPHDPHCQGSFHTPCGVTLFRTWCCGWDRWGSG